MLEICILKLDKEEINHIFKYVLYVGCGEDTKI